MRPLILKFSHVNSKAYTDANLDTRHENGRIIGHMWGSLIVRITFNIKENLLKSYLILDFAVKDLEAFMEYVNEIPEHIEKHQGKYIVEGVKPEVIEGDWEPERVVVLEFPSRENAKGFLEDPNVRPLFAIRHQSTTSKLILVDGGSWRDAYQ
jgi:uncharacterized protein (DUF1330 family)